MPYTLANLPDHVQSLSAKKQRQWMHIFNGCHADGKPESKCFAMANAVATKELSDLTPEELELVVDAKSYQYVDSWEYSEHQISQNAANYKPLGFSDAKGCANCHWFISPGRCTIVAGEISPTGLSDLWRAQSPMEVAPIPVTIVPSATVDSKQLEGTVMTTPTSGQDGLLAKLRGLVARAANGQRSATSSVRETRAFNVVKQKDGRMRFYTVWSNNFKDREQEIFSKAAHKEFVEWAEANNEYPELWLWHTKGSEFGKVDWLDATDDGFVHASGLIDSGKEELAEKLSEKECGVSHGFFGLQSGNIIHWYRSYELSVLPLENAAVPTTSFNLLNAGKAAEVMGFTPQRRQFLADMGIADDQIKAWETNTEGLAEALKAAGLESKAADLGLEVAPPPTPEQKLESDFRVETTKALMGLQEVLAGMAAQVKAIDERTKDIKSGDAVVAAAMTPPVNGAVAASKSNDNVVTTDPNGAATGQEAQAASDFFTGTVLGPLIGGRAQ